MNHDLHARAAEFLEPPLEAAVQAVLAEQLPNDAEERVRQRARRLATASTVTVSATLSTGHQRRRTKRAVIAAIASAALVLVAVTLMLDRSTSRVFAQVVEKMKAASSVRFTTAMRLGQQPEVGGVMWLEGNRLRHEQWNGELVTVADLDRKQALMLSTKRKESQLLEMEADVARVFANPIDQLRNVKSNEAEPIGEETLEGRRTLAFRIREINLMGIKGHGEMLVWVDATTNLPVKIQVRDPDPKTSTEIRFEKFVWNQPVEARLFSLIAPEGFRSGSVVLLPPAGAPTKSETKVAAIAEGIIRDRVPARIVWGPTGSTITALMRDPEAVPTHLHRANELRQWEVASGQMKWSEKVAGAGSVAASKDGKSLAIVIGREVQIRDASTGQITRKWASREPLGPLAFSPDGKTLAAGITEWGPHGGRGGKVSGGVEFWNIEQASLLRSITDDKPVTFLKYCVDGRNLVTSSNDGPVKLWDTTTGELTRIVPGGMAADVSSDGEFIACVSATAAPDNNAGTIDLFRLKDGSKVKSFTSERGLSASHLLWVTFSPDGRLLATADWNGSVTLWDVSSGNRQQITKDSQAGVHTAVFAPDGSTLALGSEDQTLRLWKLPAETTRIKPE